MIKFIVFDFDGVFTDGKFYFDNNDNIKKCYNAKDAYSLKIIKKYDIKCGIITNDKIISIEHAPHIFNRLDKVSLGSNKSKLEILDTWLDEYGFTYKDVAYIGDDLPDIPIMEKVDFSACPCDAIEEVKKVSEYVCKNKGGEGAVREFVDLIIKNNISKKEEDIKVNNDGKITAVIPVRKGSVRCKNKNIRNFWNINILKLKIEILKKVENISEIIVSTDCDIMLEEALKQNVKVHKRDVYYASSKCPNYEYWTHIAENVGLYENFMMVNAVSPLINSELIQSFVQKYIDNKFKNMVTVNNQKKFFCNSITTEGINFDSKKTPNSQDLIPLSEITFGICIATRNDIIENKCIYGKDPVFFNLDSVSGIDIDDNSDFIMAELLYKNNIQNENTCKMILEKRNDKIMLLDCTIRDGGYLNNWEFSDEEVLDCYKAVTDACYEYFEIGFRTNKKLLENKGKWCYSTEEDINKIYQKYNGCKIAVMAKIGTVTIDDFIKKDNSHVTMVRVLLARSTSENGTLKSYYNRTDIIKAKTFCQQLIDYGYEVCMNFGCGDIINDDEIKIIASEFHNVKINAIYLADTYGGFNTQNLPIKLHKIYSELEKYHSKIPFGFHSHNNNEDALDKTKLAIFHGCTMIDSCIGGLGRGAGNLKTEQLMTHLYKDKTEYITKITPIIIYFDKHILSKTEYHNNNKIHSHPYYMISSALSLHPNYISNILNMDTNVIEDINLILKIDKYTKEHNERNYNKDLINRLL
jgi:YrbI family 3-deoxy-D-manno-octulosonate 8-phosphate phosphatase